MEEHKTEDWETTIKSLSFIPELTPAEPIIQVSKLLPVISRLLTKVREESRINTMRDILDFMVKKNKEAYDRFLAIFVEMGINVDALSDRIRED